MLPIPVPAFLFAALLLVAPPPASDTIARASIALRPLVFLKGVRTRTFTLDERMAHHRVPGVSLAIVGPDGVIHGSGFGVMKAGSAAPVTPVTLFQHVKDIVPQSWTPGPG